MTERNEYIDKKIMTYSAVSLALTFIAIVLRCICLVFFYDAGIGYYNEGILPSMLGALCFVSALFFASAIFKVGDDTKCSDGKEQGTLIKVVSCVAAIAFLPFVLFGISFENNILLSAVTLLAVVASIVYFLANIFFPKAGSEPQALCGFGVVAFAIITIVVTNFDYYELLNGPNKINLHLALLSVMLFVLAEIRAFAGVMRKGYYIFTLTAATFFTGVSSFPVLIYRISTGTSISYLNYHIAVFGIFVYLVARLISFTLASGRAEKEKTEDGQ